MSVCLLLPVSVPDYCICLIYHRLHLVQTDQLITHHRDIIIPLHVCVRDRLLGWCLGWRFAGVPD